MNMETFICNFACEILSRIFNCNACVYQTATRWDLPPYQITIGVTDWWCSVCLFAWWFDARFLLQRFDIGNQWIWTRVDYHLCFTSESVLVTPKVQCAVKCAIHPVHRCLGRSQGLRKNPRCRTLQQHFTVWKQYFTVWKQYFTVWKQYFTIWNR